MGKVEKVVVLSVLLVISIILAVSLSTSEEAPMKTGGPGESEVAAARPERVATRVPEARLSENTTGSDRPAAAHTGAAAEASAPRELAPVELNRPRRDAQREPEPSAGRNERPNAGLLTSAVSPEPSRDVGAASALTLPEDSDLQTSVGLAATVNPDYLVYVCRAGDTFENVAGKLYGDRALAGLLRRYNEGLLRLTSGREILIPVRDDGGFTGDEYIVVEGDSLWIISRKVLGKGSRWSELYEANRDVLASPESLMPGMVLRIP